ncbi:MAG: AbrB/MazE/SpoVT family DNA-binding domain-containing protein [Oscillospiraceae bacterium]
MTTSIQKWGNSQGLRIPKILLDTLNWTEGQQIEIILKEDEIVLKSAKEKKKSIQELFEDYHDEYQAAEIDWGEPEGNEVW